MSSIGLIFTLFAFFVLTSCQVKEAASNGGLISGHAPATNSFVVSAPTSKTYVETETITFVVSYPFDIISNFTGGNPRLRLTVGSTTQYGIFDSQPEPRKLVFKYIVQAGDSDANGIDVNALELNGSTLQFDNQGVLTNCDVSTVTTKNFSGAKIDTIAPVISNFTLTNFPGLYNAGEKINFSMTFSEKVYVTGTPKFVMNLTTGGAVNVTYVTGSGSTLLAFSYTVSATDADTDGYDGITSPIDVGTGAIKDVVGNIANTDFSGLIAAVITYSNNVKINGQYPYVVNTVVPANGTYLVNDNLDFVLQFDRPVDVTGSPYLAVVIGSNTRQAQYLSGSGTEHITFRYTAVPGDVDPDGISVTGSIVQNAGNIVDSAVPTSSYFGDVLNNSFNVPATSGIILNAIEPQAISVARNVDNTAAVWGTAEDNVWIIGQQLNLTVGFNTGIFVNQTNGTPSITLTIGSTSREALYLSGGNGQTSLVFRYTIQEGDLDTDGTIALGSINLNGGVMTDSENTNALLTLPIPGLSSTRIDGVKPTISSVTKTAVDGTYSQVSTLNAAAMDFTVNWSEAVNYSSLLPGAAYLSMDIGGEVVLAEYESGNNTATIVHSPDSLANKNDANGITLSSPLAGTAVIKDQAGNTGTVFTYSPPATTNILVDTTAPVVSSMSPVDSNKTFKALEDIQFTVTFSEIVTTNVAGGYPRIPVTIGSTTRYLTPTANATGQTHTFSYTVASGEEDTDGIEVIGTFQNNGATAYARDEGRNYVVSTFTAPSTPNVKVDAVLPTVISASASTARTYTNGETLQISVTFSENITVTTTGGTPYIAVDFDQGTDNYVYATGTGTPTLVFRRLLDTDHFDMNGLPASVSSINLGGGLLQDAGRNDAPLTFPAQDLSSTTVTYEEVKLWAKNNFVNKIVSATAASIQNNGAITTETCGTGTCRTFTGDDSLELLSPADVNTVLIAFRTPAATDALVTYDLFSTGLVLESKFMNSNFDMGSRNGTLTIDNFTYASTSSHDTNLNTNSTYVAQMEFDFSENFSGILINTSFPGAVGEVIAIDGTFTDPAKLVNIKAYLDNEY